MKSISNISREIFTRPNTIYKMYPYYLGIVTSVPTKVKIESKILWMLLCLCKQHLGFPWLGGASAGVQMRQSALPLTLGMPVCETALILPPSCHWIFPLLLPSRVTVSGGKTGLPTHTTPYDDDPRSSRADLGPKPWLRRKEIPLAQWTKGP